MQSTEELLNTAVSRRDMLLAAGGTAAALAASTSAKANPIRRCTAPEFIRAREVQHPKKWERDLPRPEKALTQDGKEKPAAGPKAESGYAPVSLTSVANWKGRHPMHKAEPIGWIRIADIRAGKVEKIYDADMAANPRALTPPMVRPAVTPDEKRLRDEGPVAGQVVDRTRHKVAPEFWQVEGGFAPEHFWRRLESMGVKGIPIYQVVLGELEAEIVPGYMTPVWGYNRQVPGPTFLADVMGPIVVRFINELPMEASVHLHGGHTPAHSDGHPAFLICSGDDEHKGEPKPFNYRDYFYTNGVPKLSDSVPLKDDKKWDWSESGSTMWYHDHANDITAHNALMGLAGFFIVRDAWERHMIRNRVLPALDYDDPKKSRDIPMVFGDRCICVPRPGAPYSDGKPVGRIHFDPFDHNGYLGTIPICNGMAFPRLDVAAAKYRLRFLNGSLARVHLLELWEEVETAEHSPAEGPANDRVRIRKVQRPWVRVAKDTWLFPEPVADNSILLGMANRADVIVDFKALMGGKKRKTFFIVNACDQRNGRGPGHGDNGMADADGALGDRRQPRGNLEAVPNLADAGRQDEFREADGGSRGMDEDTFRVVRIEATDDGSVDPCIFPMTKENVEELYKQRDEMARAGRWSHGESALGKAVAAECEKLKSPEVMNRPENKSLHAVEKNEIEEAGGAHLREHDDLLAKLSPAQIASLPVRVFEFERGRGAWRISHKFFSEKRTDAPVRLGGLEVWHLINRSGGWWHPIHIHLESHQHISNVFDGKKRRKPAMGAPLKPGESNLQPQDQFKHDTTTLGPNTHVAILMRFRTFLGPIVFHCHNLNHEDMRMMTQFDPQIVPDDPVGPQAPPADLGPDAPKLQPMVPDTIVATNPAPHLGSRKVQQFFGDHCE